MNDHETETGLSRDVTENAKKPVSQIFKYQRNASKSQTPEQVIRKVARRTQGKIAASQHRTCWRCGREEETEEKMPGEG